MCGYVEINGERPGAVMQQPDFSEYLALLPTEDTLVYYPAFGQNPQRTIDLVIREQGELKKVKATWWFDCFDSAEGLLVGNRTTFNARNLESTYWKTALSHQRGIVFATGIGESKLVGKTKHQYYMQSEEVFALGALFRKYPGKVEYGTKDRYSCAIITRDAHPKMAPYHDKAFPCFLPMNAEFFDIWTDERIQQHPRIDFVLNNPTLYPTLKVERVKTYKDKVVMKSSPSALLTSDLLD